jgi:hypothetical protein
MRMSERFTLVESLALDRRDFTVRAALAILAGCVISITEIACRSDTPAAPTVTPAAAPVVPLADVTGVVAANHGHVAVITGAQITAGGALSLDIRGTAAHTHTVSISQTDLASLKNKQAITTQSSTDSSHSHSVTFTPV